MAFQRAAWLATAAIAVFGCSGDPSDGGAQPYGAGTDAKETMMPEAGDGAAGLGGSGGAGGVAGVSGIGGGGGDVIAGQGGGDELPACNEASQPAMIGACVTLPVPMAGEHISMTGVVEAIEPSDASSCAHRALGFMTGPIDGDVHEIVIRDGDSVVIVSARLPSQLPWSTAFVSIGEKVSVEYKAELPMDSVGHGVLTLRDAAGNLRLWVVQAAHGFDSVAVPELTISDDLHACTGTVPCGTSTHGGVRAFDGTDEVSIEYARYGEVGGLVVVLGDNTEVTVAEGCSGTRSFHRVVIAAMRGGGIPPD
jgi:hypothetical protein